MLSRFWAFDWWKNRTGVRVGKGAPENATRGWLRESLTVRMAVVQGIKNTDFPDGEG
ncbi:hypothetical protein SCOR_27805 [Sulfidibacter corallicola]